jgi:superoxide dismutase, Fe-Mn family
MPSCDSAITRRDFVRTGAAAVSALALGGGLRGVRGEEKPAEAAPELIPMPVLPYVANALEPHISERTVHLHYNGHHKLYLKTLVNYVSVRQEYQKLSLEQIVTKTTGGVLFDESMFTVAVLLWNHNVYWQSMRPRGGKEPKKAGAFGEAVKNEFGSFDKLKQAVLETSRTIGIGWVWLVKENGALKVVWTDYQNTPFVEGRKPLMALDVWEHAYYLDYQNQRDKYVTAWLEHLANWDFAVANYGG